MTDKLKDAIKAAVEDVTGSEGGLYPIYWNYDDEYSPENISKALKTDNPEETIYDSLWNLNYDYLEDSFLNDVKSQIDDKIKEEFEEMEFGDLYDFINEETSFIGFDLKISELLEKSKYKINLILETPKERKNAPYTYNIFNGSAYYTSAERWKDEMDNGLSYLIHQQGYMVRSIVKTMENGGHTPAEEGTLSEFEKSIVSELENIYNDEVFHLTVLALMDGNQLIELHKAIKEGGNIRVKKSDRPCLLLYDKYAGSGGAIEIELNKDFMFPASYISEIQIENGVNEKGTYTVNDTYDLVGKCWTECINIEPSGDIDVLCDNYSYIPNR